MSPQDLALAPTTVAAEAQGHPQRWIILFLVLAAEVVDLVDSTIVNIAAPTIRLDLDGSASTMQWFLAAYTLAFAVSLVTSARVGDIVGRRTMFLIGMGGFTAASLLCGMAASPGMLIGCRLVQGMFGAAMIPQGLALIKDAFPPEELGKAFTAFGPVMGLSAVLGPVLAGVLLDADLFGTGWRMIFLINVPVGLTAFVGAFRYLPAVRLPGRAVRLDPLGSALITVASALLIYPLVEGHDLGWPRWTFAMMAGALVLFAVFAWNERRSADPIIEPSLFRVPAFTGGLAVILTMFVAMTGLILVFNLYTQLGLGFSPLHAGLAFVPWSLGIAIGAALAGAWLGPKYGRTTMHAGLLLVAVAMVGLWWTVDAGGGALSAWDMAPSTFVAGIGSGLVFAPMFDTILAGVNERQVGSASGVLNAFQQFGGAVGVAVLGTMFFELLPAHRFAGSMEAVTLASAGLFLVSFGCTFLLPRHARPESTSA
jgi:EmrB/QacA subfamily drug resistance transporter